MIDFLLKLWKLNRPYKGRFILGVLFGMLNGVAQPLMYGTAFFVVTVIFTPQAARESASMFSVNESKDWSKFINRLRGQADPVSAFLWGRLPIQDHVLLTNYQSPAPNANEAPDVAVQGLNR